MNSPIWFASVPRTLLWAFLGLAGTASLCAQTPPPPAKRLPPAGIEISPADRRELTAGAEALGREIAALGRSKAAQKDLLALIPDVAVFHKAVEWALNYDEFFDAGQVAAARELLRQGHERAAQLSRGEAPWLDATGLVIRGYRSRLDDSVQPYGVVVPPTWRRGAAQARRLDVVLPGRGEKRSELAFIVDHQKNPGEIVPPEAIILHPYGRYCNATKFAGEVDVFEALAAVRQNYAPTGETVLRGFSMGGASVWHLAVHHPGTWRAASPGAGFAETGVYTKAFAPGKEPPTWWEQKLWNWYDATAAAGNLFNLPTIAYSGELDPQKQSADIMEAAMAKEGLKLERLIGPQTGHKYHPETRDELAARLAALAATARPEPAREVRFTTYTLRYPTCDWVTLFGLERHWDRADVVARLDGTTAISMQTKNVTQLRLNLPNSAAQLTFTLDGQNLVAAKSKGSPHFWFTKSGGQWQSVPELPKAGLRKEPGLTGPIDDAFMEGFLFVRPTGKPFGAKSGTWASKEEAHAAKMWRDIFRGEAPVKNDTAITPEDILNKNLVLWGDPSSNQVIAQVLNRLPLQWTAGKLVFRGQTYDAAHHMPILIFPNPLNPRRYIVLNSGIDFRTDAYGTNALQIAKLPDFAIVDIDTPPGPKWPGKIVTAGFFDEAWK